MGRELQSQDRQQHEQHSEGKRKRMLEPQAQPEQQEGTDLEHQLIQITKRNRKEKRQRGIEDPRQQQQAPEQGVGSQLGQQQQQQQLERKPKKRRHVPEVDIQTEHKKQKKQVDSRELGRDAPQQREQEEEQAKQLQKAEQKAKRQQKREEEARQQREQEEEQAKQLQKAERKAKRQQKHEEEARRQREQEQEEEQGRPQQEQQEEPEAIPASSLEPSASQPTPASAAAGASTPGGFKFWSEADAARLVQCVEDDQYRSQHLGEATLDWKAVAAHFGRSTQAVRSKYRHLKLVEEHGTEVFARGRSARAPISYSYMALYALSTLPDQSGTGSEVCAVVERYPVFQPRLDRTFRPDCTGVFRWQQRIREELSHQCIFRATGTKRGGEMVWQLDLSSIDEIPRNLRKKVAEMKLAGAPHMGKHGNSNG